MEFFVFSRLFFNVLDIAKTFLLKVYMVIKINKYGFFICSGLVIFAFKDVVNQREVLWIH